MKIKYYVMLIISAIIWGTGFIGVKIAIDEGLQPFFISGARFFVASIILGFILRKEFANTKRSTYRRGSVLGVLLFLGFSFQTLGLKYTTISNNAFITAIYVIIVPFLYWIIYKKKPNLAQFVSAFLSLVGVRILSLSSNPINSNFSIGNIGDFLTLLSAFFFAAHMIMLGIYTQHHSPLMLTWLQLVLASIVSMIFSFALEPLPHISINAMLAIVYLGVFSSLVAFSFQNIAQKHISQITASLILSLESLFGTIFSILLLYEKISIFMVLGGFIIINAILLSEIKFKIPKTSPKLPEIKFNTPRKQKK